MTLEQSEIDRALETAAQNPFFQSFLNNPYMSLAFLRQATPAMHEPNTDAWFVTRAVDVEAVLRSPLYGKDPRKAEGGRLFARVLNPDPNVEPSMLVLDPPDHARLRGLVNKAFTPRSVAALEGRVREIAGELLDTVADQPGFDLMDTLASPLPIMVIAEMIGVDPGDRDQFRQRSQAVAAGLDPFAPPEVHDTARQARQALGEYFERAIAEHRAAPRNDLISGLIAAQEGDDRLSETEMIQTLSLLLVAGNVTTTDLIGNGILALLEHADELQKLRGDPAIIGHAVEEMLRYDTPVLGTSRVSLQGVEVGGCPIPAHQTIAVSLAGANRDPSSNPDPDRFDISREEIHHSSFGGGPHYCLGAPLARLEAALAIGTIIRRFPNLRLDPERPPLRRPSPAFRGHVSVHVLTSAPA